MESTYEVFARQVMQAAVSAPGFISGEALRQVDDPNYRLIILKMRTQGDWEKWRDSPARRASTELISPLLLEPEQTTVFKH